MWWWYQVRVFAFLEDLFSFSCVFRHGFWLLAFGRYPENSKGSFCLAYYSMYGGRGSKRLCDAPFVHTHFFPGVPLISFFFLSKAFSTLWWDAKQRAKDAFYYYSATSVSHGEGGACLRVLRALPYQAVSSVIRSTRCTNYGNLPMFTIDAIPSLTPYYVLRTARTGYCA